MRILFVVFFLFIRGIASAEHAVSSGGVSRSTQPRADIPQAVIPYVGDTDCGIAKGWASQRSYFAANQFCQVSIRLTRTKGDDGASSGEVEYDVYDGGEGQEPTTFTGAYTKVGNHIVITFKESGLKRGLELVTNRDGEKTLEVTMSTSRKKVILVKGAPIAV